MVTAVKRLCTNIFTSLNFFYRTTRRFDHRMLSHFILKITQQQDIDSIIYQTSRCLYRLLDYKYFAFAMYDKDINGGIDIWMDPKTDDKAVLETIKQDFSPQNLYLNIRYFENTDGRENSCLTNIDTGSIMSFDLSSGQTSAVLYLLPQRTMLGYHHELLDIVLRTLATALANVMNMKKLESAALIDPLTHCYNRRALMQHLEHDVATAERYGRNLSVIMFDMDHFKHINDTHGHQAGDAVLQAVSKRVLAAIRKSDYLARYGGEEFMLVLRGTKYARAIELAERLRKITEHLDINRESSAISVTASFGVTTFKKGMDAAKIIKKADEMLYDAKRKGRNRISPDLRVYHTMDPDITPEEPRFH